MKIQNTSEISSDKIRIVIAGEAGNGKTTLAKTIQEGLGERVLVISAEAGLLSLRGCGVDYVELQQTWDDEKKYWVQIPKAARITRLAEIYTQLMRPEMMSTYRWVFIDSLTEISQLMLDSIEVIEEFQGPKNTIKKYGELSSRMMGLAKTFRDMPHYGLVMSALVKEDTDADNQRHLKVSVIGSFAERLPALFDEVLYLGVSNEVNEQGQNVRRLLTQKTDKILFPKDRSGKLERLEPADLSVIIKKIRGVAMLEDISLLAKAKAAEAKAIAVQTEEAQKQGESA